MWLPAAVLIPAAGGVLGLFAQGKWRRRVGAAAASASLLTAWIVASSAWCQGPARYRMAGWGAPLGIDLRLDGLAAAFLLLTATVAAMTAVFAWSAERGPTETVPGNFWPLFQFLWAALNGLFLSGDLFNLYVQLELMTLSAIGLIGLSHQRAAIEGALNYLTAALLGSFAYLLGVGLTYSAHGVLDLGMLSHRISASGSSWLMLSLLSVGLLLKTAVFPLHFWLPEAHAKAISPVSALLSGLVVKASFYILMRLWLEVFFGSVSLQTGSLLGALGSAAILWGSVQAIRQRRLKPMIAYSTVSQLGYLFLALPAATAAGAGPGAWEWKAEAWNGAALFALSHGLAKASLFLSAGALISSVGSDEIARVHGLARNLRGFAVAFGVAGINLVGLPPSGGFLGKWLLLGALLRSGQWIWALPALAGTLMTAIYIFKVLERTFLSEEAIDPGAGETRPVPRGMEIAALVLAVISVLLGILPAELLEILRRDSPFGMGGAE